jgi:putative ABC transport system substrate-binding protein
MDRRQVLIVVSASISSPAVLSQQKVRDRPFRTGLFSSLVEPFWTWVRGGLRAAGWREGKHYVLVDSSNRYDDPSPEEARRLLAMTVDLVLTNSTAHAIAIKKVDARVPIVMWGSGYPVEAGLADSLVHPGRNVTGLSSYAGTGVWGKLLQLLRDAVPSTDRVGVAWGYVPPVFPREEIEPCYRELRAAAKTLRVALRIEEIPNPTAVTTALASLQAFKPQALLITPGPGFYVERQRVMQFAVDHRLPTAADWLWPADDPLRPLLVYSPSLEDTIRQATSYVVQILEKGQKPGDLPIQQPARFITSVNKKSANQIGLVLPQPVLIQADHVLE